MRVTKDLFQQWAACLVWFRQAQPGGYGLKAYSTGAG
jgi:hypothetical protein